MIRIDNLTTKATKISSCEPLLSNVSCTFPSSLITAIVGKSGVGKTTLLYCIAQLQEMSAGSICVYGRKIQGILAQERAQLIGFVFQNFNLFPQLTALENCMQPLMVVNGLSYVDAQAKALNFFTSFDLAAYKNAYPATLSGGQKQRVAIARARMLGPQVLLLDEPTSALDQENSMILAQLLKKLSRQGVTIVVTSHDKEFVSMVQDKTFEMVDGCMREIV
jgi:ABC-type polar amino acid transport system ATPase subunit